MSILDFEHKPTSYAQRTNHTKAERQKRAALSVATFHARNDVLLDEIQESLLHQNMLVKDLEHRISHGLQLAADLSMSQGRTAATGTADRLPIAANLIAELELLSSQLRFIGQQKAVEMTEYLQHHYEELHHLRTSPQVCATIALVAAALEKATTSTVGLGSCLEEFLTNSVTCVDLTGIFDQRIDSFSVDTN